MCCGVLNRPVELLCGAHLLDLLLKVGDATNDGGAPHSQKSTTSLSVFKVGDSATNLHTALDMYKEHIQEIHGMKIKYAAKKKNKTKHAHHTSLSQILQWAYSLCLPVRRLWVSLQDIWPKWCKWWVHSPKANEIHKITDRHNCLWCLIPSSSLKVSLAEWGRFTTRSLELLRSDHSDFVSSGGGDVKKAKFFNNVIEDYMYFFDILLENVIEVYIH